MKEFSYVIKDELGIHARPAGMLVKKASEFSSSVTIEKGAKQGDAKRLFAVMGLGVKKGDEIFVKIEGEDEEEAYDVLYGFLKENL